jgi:hypothetical protein
LTGVWALDGVLIDQRPVARVTERGAWRRVRRFGRPGSAGAAGVEGGLED